MTLLDDVKREVDKSVWCDSIEWRGKTVTFRSELRNGIPPDDPGGSRIVATWRRQLEEVAPRSVRVNFRVKTYGCVRKKQSDRDPSSIKTWTHCWAIFEVVVL